MESIKFRRILGLDILPGESPQSSRDPRFAYLVLVDGEVRERGEERLSRILKLAEEFRIDAIAIDNVYELACSREGLADLLRRLRHVPKLVQVTMVAGKTYPLDSLAESLGLARGKLNPLQAAEVSAKLAYLGVGSELLLFEEETRIIVSKGRSPAQGGMSLERYKRNVESLVLNKTREIRSSLERLGVDYDVFVSRGKYGVERSVFIVYAPRTRLYGVVKPFQDRDLQVEIEPVIRSKPVFIPLSSPSRRRTAVSRYLIVGVDPGISTGIAALTLKGDLLMLTSGKELGRGQVIRMIAEHGVAVLIATDVNPAPLYVKKLAAMLNAELFVPPHSLSVEEKRALVSEYVEKLSIPLKIRDSHQRDALAAALYALRKFSAKFMEVREKIGRLGLDIPEEEVDALVVRGIPVWEAIRAVSREYYLPTVRERPLESRDEVGYLRKLSEELNERIVKLVKRIRSLEKEKEELLEKLSTVETQLWRVLKIQSAEARRDRIVESLQKELSRATAENARLRESLEELDRDVKRLRVLLSRAARGELVLAPRFRRLPEKLEGDVAREGVIVLGVLQPNDYERLLEFTARKDVRVILCEQNFSEYYAEMMACRDVALLRLSEVKPLDVIGDVYIFEKKSLEEAASRKLEELEVRSEKLLKDSLRRIMEEYRAERLRRLRLKTS